MQLSPLVAKENTMNCLISLAIVVGAILGVCFLWGAIQLFIADKRCINQKWEDE